MIIVIAQNSGGVGKSTLAQHLAAYMSNRRGIGALCLVDADKNSTSVDWFERGEESERLKQKKFDVLPGDAENLDEYEHLIIDSAAGPTPDELGELMDVADLLLLPTTPSPYDLMPAIATAQGLDIDESRYMLVLGLCPPAPSTLGATAHKAIVDSGVPVAPGWITRRNCYIEAAFDGCTVNELKGASAKKAWGECQRVFKAILKGRL